MHEVPESRSERPSRRPRWHSLAAVALLSGVLPAGAAVIASPAGASAAPSETFSAQLNGGQETPPHATAASGTGTVTLSSDESSMSVSLSWSGLTANALAAHIHGPAAPGTAGPVLFPLTGVAPATSGSITAQTFSVTQTQVAQLKAGQFYFNVHSSNFPAGEIRGQIHIQPPPSLHFGAGLTAGQETPPHASAGTGSGTVTLSPDEATITAGLSWSALGGAATAAHIHGPALPGTAAPVLFPFAGVPSAPSGSVPPQTFPITRAQVAQLKAGLLYFNVHTKTFPGGEIRGQIRLSSDAQGLRVVASDDTVFGLGTPPLGVAAGSPSRLGGQALNAPVVTINNTPDWLGYWTAATDGGVFAFGDAGYFGSLGGTHLNAPVVGMAHTPSGVGYWLAAADGGVFSFGDAGFFGSLGSVRLNSPVVAIESTPDGKGYWMVAADGGVFAFGDAAFAGSLGGQRLAAPVVGVSRTSDGKGYWLAAADGGVFTFGNAAFFGSHGGGHVNTTAAAVGISRTPDGGGYWVSSADGGISAFGDATPLGSVVLAPGDKSITAIAAAGTD